MAVDLCSETSPRISFSHDLNQTNGLPLIQPDSSLLDPEFEFEICNIFEQESSSADELFSHGILLPTQIHERTERPKLPNPEPQRSLSLTPSFSEEPSIAVKESSKEADVKNIASEEKIQTQSKSFWNFNRSSSLNHEGKKGLICALQLLSRSHSTGSTSSLNSKKSMPSSKENNIQKKQRSSKYPLPKSSSLSSVTSAKYNFSAPQPKPQSRWSYGGGTSGSYGHGGRISPVLNVPSPYISNAATSLFGFGSLFCNSKDKKSKKRS